MRILILGGDGMLGHQLLTTLAPLHDVHVTLRRALSAYTHLEAISDRKATAGVDAREWTHLSDVIKRTAPEALINCIGIVKQRKERLRKPDLGRILQIASRNRLVG